jgi:DNA-binding NarL/FixJ family response regulator
MPVILPAVRGLPERARRVVHDGIVRLVLGVASDGTPMTLAFGSPVRDIDARLAAASATWQLTPRQAEVLAGVVEGASNKEIAGTLGRAENTVELHLTQLLRKAGVSSRTRLLARFWSEL